MNPQPPPVPNGEPAPQGQPVSGDQSAPNGQPVSGDQRAPHGQPVPGDQPAPNGQPLPYGQAASHGQTSPNGQSPSNGQSPPSPNGQPAPNSQPTPNGQPAPYGQPAPNGQPPSNGQPPPYGQPTPTAPGERLPNKLGVSALITGIAAFIGAFVPILNFVTAVAALVAIVLGIIALCLKNRRRRAAIAATIISPLAFIASVIMVFIYMFAFFGNLDELAFDGEPHHEVGVTLEVTGTAHSADVEYSYRSPGSVGGGTNAGVNLPFSKHVDMEVRDEGGDARVTVSADAGVGGEVTCRILIDGVVVTEDTGTSVSCVATRAGDSDTGTDDKN